MAWDMTNQEGIMLPISPPGGQLVQAATLTRSVSVGGAGLGKDGFILNSSLFLGSQVMMMKHLSFLHVKIILLVCTAVELLTLHSWWAVKIYA